VLGSRRLQQALRLEIDLSRKLSHHLPGKGAPSRVEPRVRFELTTSRLQDERISH